MGDGHNCTLKRGILEEPKNEAEKPAYAWVSLSNGEGMKGLRDGGHMHAQHKETGRQAGSGGEGTREKAVYAHKAVGGGPRGGCRGHCGGARDGFALVKEQRPKQENKDPCRDVVSTRVSFPGGGEGVPPQQLGGWGGCRQPDVMTGAGKTSAWKEEGYRQWQQESWPCLCFMT